MSATAKWHDAEPPATAQNFTYSLTNSNVAGSPTPLSPTFVASGTGSDASAPVPAALAVPGSFTLNVQNAFGVVQSAPFVGAAPAVPTSFSIS